MIGQKGGRDQANFQVTQIEYNVFFPPSYFLFWNGFLTCLCHDKRNYVQKIKLLFLCYNVDGFFNSKVFSCFSQFDELEMTSSLGSAACCSTYDKNHWKIKVKFILSDITIFAKQFVNKWNCTFLWSKTNKITYSLQDC